MMTIPPSSRTGFDGFFQFGLIRLLQRKISSESFPLLPKLLVWSDGRGNHREPYHATMISVCLVVSYGVCSLLWVLELDSLGFDIFRRKNNNPYIPTPPEGIGSGIL